MKLPSIAHGFFRNQLIWFLSISLLPLLIVSFLNYRNTREVLSHAVMKELDLLTNRKVKNIEAFFKNNMKHLLLEANKSKVAEILEELSVSLKNSGKTPGEFVKMEDWEHLAEKSQKKFDYFLSTNDYYDLHLIDKKGNILFSDSRGEDLGTNIFQGQFSTTKFGRACRRAWEAEIPYFSDFEKYMPAGDSPACFLISLIHDKNGKKQGLMAVYVSVEKIHKIMQAGELGSRGDAYLIGDDLLLRSHSRMDESSAILSEIVKTAQALKWQEETTASDVVFSEGEDYEKAEIYAGRSGVDVLGTYREIEVGGVKLAVITEIPVSEAFSVAREQRNNAILMLLGASFLIVIVAFRAARNVTTPLQKLTELSERVAAGDLAIREDDISTSRNEFGQVSRSFGKVVYSLKEVASVCEKISKGIFKDKVTVRSDKDVLSHAVNRMIDNFKEVISQTNAVARGEYSQVIALLSEEDELGRALLDMTANLRSISEINERNNWFKTGQTELAVELTGGKELEALARDVVVYLAKYLKVEVGTLYVAEEDNTLALAGTYSFRKRKNINTRFNYGEGLIGEVAREKDYILLEQVPDDYVTVESSLGSGAPRQILAMPFVLEGELKGVVELGSFKEFSERQIEFLKEVSESVAKAIHTAQEVKKTRELLERTQSQAEELQVQQEELREANERLMTQEEELRVTNEELVKKTKNLEQQKKEIERRNVELENTRQDLLRKAKELEVASRYKSEFLANMSHELRTPLNSLLLISGKFAKNREKNLTEKQVQLAEIVYNSGNNLLHLINEILDLAKIEAGKMNVISEAVPLRKIMENMTSLFTADTEEKGLSLKASIDPDLPATIKTDQQRLEQMLRNLISNAVKFTENGEIRIRFFRPEVGVDLRRSGLGPARTIGFAVSDTGIGIPEDKQLEIFEAFQQVDGTTSRKFGGTGLGLSITRELAKLLGGEIQLKSKEGEGSHFAIYLPCTLENKSSNEEVRVEMKTSGGEEVIFVPAVGDDSYAHSIADDRNSITENDHVVLIIEDDMNFSRMLAEICHEKGFKYLHAPAGEKGLKMAEEFLPGAIILDLSLPGIQGVQVLEMLKNNMKTRHIPVQIISATERDMDVFQKGAVGYLTKPVTDEQLDAVFSEIGSIISRDIKELLVIEDDEDLREGICRLHESDSIHVTACGRGQDGLDLLQKNRFDCIILDLRLPDMSGFDILHKFRKMEAPPPVVVYTGKDLTSSEELELKRHADSIVIKGVMSDERLLDETTLFLHTVIEDLGRNGRSKLKGNFSADGFMEGKKVLVVDDDMRNLFALADELEDMKMKVIKAANGREALEMLAEEPDIDIVLMDIMMPEMNGYEAIAAIRRQRKHGNLPILALTAKAMREDRDKCIEAGANDYLPKPVDMERLLSTMRVWLKN